VARLTEQRSALAVAIESASKVWTIAISFSLPALIGFGLDRWWGSGPVCTLIGVVLGFAVGLLQILRFSREIPGRPVRGKSPKPDAEAPLPETAITDSNRQDPPNS
jgi:F0F1-type ATP synthase assembly protein I